MEASKREQLVRDYVDNVLDNMSTKDLMRIVGEQLEENLASYTDEELISEIQDYYPELLNWHSHNYTNLTMYDTETKVDRDFMRRMIRAYQQDLLQLINKTPEHPGGDWAKDDLMVIEYLQSKTFSRFNQTIKFWLWRLTLCTLLL